MSPTKGQPPIENPKRIRLEVRMTAQQAEIPSACAERLPITRTEVITKGIDLVKAELDEK